MLRLFCLILMLLSAPAVAEAPRWQHALTLFGEAKYPPWFRHFDYVNPLAPKGGVVKLMHPATFDSLNLYILKGVKAPGINLLHEGLMTGSLDEPQTYYPLLATKFRRDPENHWIEFRINPKARWHDGKPVTVRDVIWSLNVLKKEADPVYRLAFAPLEEATQTAPGVVRFTFAEPLQREAPILAATMPVLPKHYYQPCLPPSGLTRGSSQNDGPKPGQSRFCGTEFNKTTLTPPLGSGPYKVQSVDPGRSITFERVKDYWGRNLPVNVGRQNFDAIRYDVYRDSTVALEAFKAGEYDMRQENIARNWATAYESPALSDGRMIKVDIPNEVPQGMQAFFFNLRKPHLMDRRVREAVSLTLDYEWINKALFYGAYKRNTSFFQYTPFAATLQLPGPLETELLEPYAKSLPPHLFDTPFRLPTTDGSGQNRQNLLKAQALLDEAGIPLVDGKRIDPSTGEPLRVEFLLNQATMQRVILPMRKGLKQLGIEGTLRLVDDAQYQRRVDIRDFDIISGWINLGVFFPGVEQKSLWHSSQSEEEGSPNVSGLENPAVDDLVERIANAHSMEQLLPASRALDRILLWEHVVIPHWHNSTFRVAYWNKFSKPKNDPKYGFAFDSWWVEKNK